MAEAARGVEPGSTVLRAVATTPRTRDRGIDVLRGLCIFSMTTAHLAAGSWPWQVTHVAIFVDGAVGFVMLSGVVVGMTQRLTIDRAGLRAGQRKLLRRMILIYGAHIGLCVVAFAVVAVDPARAGQYVGVGALGGPMAALLAALTLRINPFYTSILSLYVVLLALTIAAVFALAVRRPVFVLAGSVALYAAGLLWPDAFTLPFRPGSIGSVNWASWQLLFMAALLVGWNWHMPPVRRALASRALWCTAAVFVGLAALTGWLVTHGTGSPWKPVVARAFTEGTLAPGTIVMAIAAVLVGYRICRRLVRVAGPVVSPMAMIGRRSLDCYIILSVVVIVLPSAFQYSRTGLVAVGVTFAVLVVMIGWCLLRDRIGRPGRDQNDSRVEIAGSIPSTALRS